MVQTSIVALLATVACALAFNFPLHSGKNLVLPSSQSLILPSQRESPLILNGLGGEADSTPDTGYYDGARIGPPPDLPSLLLNNRIIYLGMPLVAQVSELIIAEFLYLNYESKTKPIYLYINTPGTMTADGKAVGFETEAFSIADTMKYVKAPVHTIIVGQAYGMGALLAAMGDKGQRSALPNASIMLHQPRSMARGQASDIAIKAREVLGNRRVAQEMMARACNKPVEEIARDCSRTKYLTPQEAVEYGLIDKVMEVGQPVSSAGGVLPAKAQAKPTFLEQLKAELAEG